MQGNHQHDDQRCRTERILNQRAAAAQQGELEVGHHGGLSVLAFLLPLCSHLLTQL